jgi:hypothetical protein
LSDDLDRFIGVNELMKRLGISRSTLYRRHRQKKIELEDMDGKRGMLASKLKEKFQCTTPYRSRGINDNAPSDGDPTAH